MGTRQEPASKKCKPVNEECPNADNFFRNGEVNSSSFLRSLRLKSLKGWIMI